MSIEKNTPNFLKHSGSSFTTIVNKTIEAIEDPATLGIYLYLASKPSDWQISETNLQNRFQKGRDFIRARLSELKLLGLLKKTSIKNSFGQIIRWESILYKEIHITENPLSGDEIHITENPGAWTNHLLVDPPTTNKRSKQIKDDIQIKDKPPIPPKGGSECFEEFWEMYPVKASKKTCLEKWKKLNLDSCADHILERLSDQIHSNDSWKRGYIPNPLTYINQEKWNDEIKLPPKQSGNSLSNYMHNQLPKGVVIDEYSNDYDPFSNLYGN